MGASLTPLQQPESSSGSVGEPAPHVKTRLALRGGTTPQSVINSYYPIWRQVAGARAMISLTLSANALFSRRISQTLKIKPPNALRTAKHYAAHDRDHMRFVAQEQRQCDMTLGYGHVERWDFDASINDNGPYALSLCLYTALQFNYFKYRKPWYCDACHLCYILGFTEHRHLVADVLFSTIRVCSLTLVDRGIQQEVARRDLMDFSLL